MTTPRCTLCRQPLDRAAVLNACSTCTDCARAAIRASRRPSPKHGAALRDAGQAVASAAHPDERAKVDAAIRRLAAMGREFSSNDARGLHGVTGPVVGAAFTAARKAGVIRAVGFTTSTDPGTHAHPVRTWIGVAA